MATKEQVLNSFAETIRNFVDQETPDVATWNVNPNDIRSALAFLGSSFTDTDTAHATLLALFLADHDAATGQNPVPPEWVPEAAAPTFLGADRFRLAGDRRADYASGHRVRLTLTGGTPVVALLTVTFDPGQNVTLITCDPPVVNSSLAGLARALVRFSAPRITTADLMVDSVTTAAILADAVTFDKIADGAVRSAHIAAAAVGPSHIAPSTVATLHLGNAAVTSSKIAPAAVATAHLQSAAVTSAAIAPGAVLEATLGEAQVSTRALADHAVTASKLRTGLLEHVATANLLRNGSFESWSAGPGVTPDAWALTGAGAVASRSAAVQQFGGACVELTAGTAASALTQSLLVGDAITPALRGAPVTLVCRIRAPVASSAQLAISDGVGSTASAPLGGSSAFSAVSITHTLDANATGLVVELRNLRSDSVAVVQFDGAMLVLGEVAPALFTPHPNDEHLRAQHYQDNTTNLIVGDMVMQSGWGYVTRASGGTVHKLVAAITFPVPFRTLFGVLPVALGRKQGATPPATRADTEAGSDENDYAVVGVEGGTLSPNGVTLVLTSSNGGTFSASGAPYHYCFGWQAWGVLP